MISTFQEWADGADAGTDLTPRPWLPWEGWRARAHAAGVDADLAELGRDVIRDCWLHRWGDRHPPLSRECGWEDEGAAMLALARKSPLRARDRWTELVLTDGLQHRTADPVAEVPAAVREALEDWNYEEVKEGIRALDDTYAALSDHGGLRAQLFELEDKLALLLQKGKAGGANDVWELAEEVADELHQHAERIDSLAGNLGSLIDYHPDNVLDEDETEDDQE